MRYIFTKYYFCFSFNRNSGIQLNIYQNFSMKIVSYLFKQDPLQKRFKEIGLISDNLSLKCIKKTVELFRTHTEQNVQQYFLKVLIKHLQQKTSHSRKLKIMSALLQIAKISKYDVCDIILNKKIKVFTKPSKYKHNQIEPTGSKMEDFILQELLIPEYNYIMKLSTNEQLYHTCKQGEIPFDDIFRRGTKIRFIWIFKLYNIINILIPIVQSLIKVHQFNPNFQFFEESIFYLFNDLVIMNNFVIKALEEASTDNFMLMPYFDMLQFHQSLKEQIQVGKNVREINEKVKKIVEGTLQPLKLSLKMEEIQEIEIQALRVKLISDSLKNPKKDHRILQTQYNDKIEKKQKRTNPTEPNFQEKGNFEQRWKHLD